MYFESNQQHCSNTSSVVTSKAPESGNIWHIESVVQLGDNCNYTINNIVSHNEAGETNSTGSLSISRCTATCIHVMQNILSLIGTRVILVNVHLGEDGVDVLCSFQHTLAESCYVQLVSDMFHDGEYLEGSREGEASHSFTGLMSGTYTVLVYGVGRKETSCLPLFHDPDYVTVVNVTVSQHSPVTSIHVPVITHEPGTYMLYDCMYVHAHILTYSKLHFRMTFLVILHVSRFAT